MAKIAIDVDGVLYKFVHALRMFIHLKYRRPLEEMPDATCWNFFSEQWGYTYAEYKKLIIEGIIDGDLMWRGDAYDNAAWGMQELYKAGHNITILTARSYEGIEDFGRYTTQYWLGTQGIPYHHLIISNAKTGYGFDCLIDDAPHNISELTAVGEYAVLFDQPWNKDVVHEHRVMDWVDAVDFVERNFH